METTHALWREARTLTDLASLTADWLSGSLAAHPGWNGEPDPETTEIADHLVALNRAGWLTIDSQPGVDRDANGYTQRHAVKFILSYGQALDLLSKAITADVPVARQTMLVPDPAGNPEPAPLLVSRIETGTKIEGACWFGTGPDEEWMWLFGNGADDLTPELHRALHRAVVCVVAAPDWGTDDGGLWTWLCETTTRINDSQPNL